MFKEKGHISQFQNIKTQHNQISFTVEHKAEANWLFNVNITRSTDGFSTDVYRKQSFTWLGLNFNSFVPLNFKTNSF